MTRTLRAFLALLLVVPALAAADLRKPSTYVPGHAWQHQSPEEAGFDPAKLKAAIDFAIAAESRRPRDMAEDQRTSFGAREPMAGIVGPMKARGDMTGETDIGIVVDSPNWPQTALVNVSFYGTPGRHEYGWVPWALAYVRGVVLAPLHALYVLSVLVT